MTKHQLKLAILITSPAVLFAVGTLLLALRLAAQGM